MRGPGPPTREDRGGTRIERRVFDGRPKGLIWLGRHGRPIRRMRLQSIVDKVTLERLKDRELRVSFLCPYCKSIRIDLDASRSTDTWNGMDCPKCGAHILLDSISLVVIKDAMPSARA